MSSLYQTVSEDHNEMQSTDQKGVLSAEPWKNLVGPLSVLMSLGINKIIIITFKIIMTFGRLLLEETENKM